MIYDITRTLRETTPVWPGDVPLRLTRSASISEGGLADTGAYSGTLHAGTHMDAPAHLLPEGTGVDHVNLATCLGEALVVDLGDATVIRPELLEPAVPQGTRRLLLRTSASARPDERWDEDFPALTPEAARWLVERGVCLVGVDAASMDTFGASDLPVHRILCEAGVVILENLALGEVPAGTYELIALPLKLADMDGSPVRAVLRSVET